jgi:hypothetical protein
VLLWVDRHRAGALRYEKVTTCMASLVKPAGNYTNGANGLPCSITGPGLQVCDLTALNEKGQWSRFCWDGTPGPIPPASNIDLPEWNLTARIDASGNIDFSDGTFWRPAAASVVAAVTSPAVVAAAVTTPTDFFSGTTFGISNLVLVGVAVVGLLFMSSRGGQR